MTNRPKSTGDQYGAGAGSIADSALSSQPSAFGEVSGLILRRDLYDAILAHLTESLPHEGVGLLATTWAEDERLQPQPTQSSVDSPRFVASAMKFYPGRNVDASPARFTMDPAEVLAALREIDERGWWLGGIVHSHPHGPAHPSPTDLREARYPDALTVIVSFAERPPRPRAWRLPLPGTGDESVADIAEVPVWVDPLPGPA